MQKAEEILLGILLMLALTSFLLPLAQSQGAPIPRVFTLTARHGVAYFSTPNHKPLWSLGVDCTALGAPGTQDNPGYDAKTLFRTTDAWVNDVCAKFKRWNVNSLGAWSDSKYFGGRLPHADVLHIGEGAKVPWTDLYAPETASALEKVAHDLVPPLAADPSLLGYFTDNELGWWDDTLFLSYFAMPRGSPGKQHLVKILKNHYHDDFAAFTREWKTGANSFEELADQTKLFLRPGTRGISVVHEFVYDLSTQYYRIAYNAIRRYDKRHIILGDRYCQYYNIATATASRPYIDVCSTNAGADWTDGTYSPGFFDNLHRITGKPLLVSEFYFSAKENQSGNGNSGTAFPLVHTQRERAIGFRRGLAQLLDMPYMLGAHWFQFFDEPPKGRSDGENWNFGLVDVRGRPYSLMVNELRQANLYTAHERAHLARNQGVVPPAPPNPMGDHLLHWDRASGRLHSDSHDQWADLYLSHNSKYLYVGLVPMEYGDKHLYEGAKVPETDRPRLNLKIGSWQGFVTYGFDQPAVASPGVAAISERPGLKHILILCIPLITVQPRTKLHAKLRVDAALTSHGSGYTMSWHQRLRLR